MRTAHFGVYQSRKTYGRNNFGEKSKAFPNNVV